MIFGQPGQQYEVEAYLEAALFMIHRELERVLWNIHQKELDPFEHGDKFVCDAFEVEPYSWDEDYDQPYNFKWKDVEISWYKHLGRSLSVNREVRPDEAAALLRECLSQLEKMDKEHYKKMVGG